ncbi:Methyl-accepting chemotaxis protein McpQ [compost metagenome]
MFPLRLPRLADLRVGHKLALGFALVLLLALLITLAAVLSLDSLSQRGDQLIRGSDLNLSFLQADRARRDFAAQGEEAQRARVEQLTASMLADAERLGRLLDDAGDRQRVTRMGEATRAYREAFSALAQARAEQQEASRFGVAAAEQGMQAFTRLEAQFFEDLEQLFDTHAMLDQIRAVGRLNQQFLQLRLLTLVYVRSPSPERERAAFDAGAALAKATRTLQGQLPERSGAILGETLEALERFQQSLERFRQGIAGMATATASMAERAEAVQGLSRELQASLLERRDRETAYVRLQLLAIAGVTLLVALLAAWGITGQIVRPLRETLAQARRIAEGDLCGTAPAARGDELGQLQQAMQAMQDSLRELIGRIGGGVGEISGAAQALSAVTEQTRAGVEEQKSETIQVATAMQEMAYTVQEVAGNAGQAAGAAQLACEEAGRGNQVVQDAIAQIERLAAGVQASAEVMARLHEDSAQIGYVLDVIRSVAEQTNLLALNAAIEAARAGEAGRGFAVVADEVRGLAQRVQSSTSQIQELIGQLQHGVQQTATAMLGSRDMSHLTVDLARQAGAALRGIDRAIDDLRGRNLQIATAAEEQSAVSEEINRSILRVQAVAEQTAAASQETAGSSQALARLGRELQGMVARFRV